MKTPIEITSWDRSTLRHILTHNLGGESTGGGQTMDGTGWDECADFLLPNGREISVMFEIDEMTAHLGMFDYAASERTLLRYEGEPAEVLAVLTANLEALGYPLPSGA